MTNYRVEKYTTKGNCIDFGILPESDVKSILKGYKYDSDLDMWFSPKATIGYFVKEC